MPTARLPGTLGGATADPAAAMLRGGMVPALLAGAVVVVVGAVSGVRPAAGAAVGTLLVVVALSVGPLLLRLAAKWPPPAMMAAALGAYGIIVMTLGVAFQLLAAQPWLSSPHLGAALLVGTGGWLAGLLRAVVRLRIPAFGSSDHDPLKEASPTVDLDSARSPKSAPH